MPDTIDHGTYIEYVRSPEDKKIIELGKRVLVLEERISDMEKLVNSLIEICKVDN